MSLALFGRDRSLLQIVWFMSLMRRKDVRNLTIGESIITVCDAMRDDNKPAPFMVIAGDTFPQGELTEPSVAARIAAFLDGRTCGEDLLHALYDYVLNEPIPQPIRALLNK
jgi:hypothetical protein